MKKIIIAIAVAAAMLTVGRALAEPAICFCNVNSDSSHNATDIGLVRAAFLTTDLPSNYDVNASGNVNATDIGLVRAAFLTPVLTCTYEFIVGGVSLLVFGWPLFYDGAEVYYLNEDQGPTELFSALTLNEDGDGGTLFFAGAGNGPEILSVTSVAGTANYTVCTLEP